MTTDYDRQVVEKALALLKKKGQDYNSAIKREDYFPHGLISYHQMLHIKVRRIQSLISDPDYTPQYEGIKDSLQDLLNYTIMALAYLEKTEDDDE